MMKIRSPKRRSFQVFFMRNDASQDVEILELENVDFASVQERLDRGESVFITSKHSQKVRAPKSKGVDSRTPKTSMVNAFCFDKV
ncbi:MAG: hypothetical protein ACE14S_10670 [Candidatus Bathyarchaeia archaeon]